jgi:hypothetical protein
LVLRVVVEGPDEQTAAERAARNLIDAGAAEILTEIGKAL